MKHGIKGRKLEVVTRDTQGDPTKAVNAALELMNREKVDFMVGPTNSGEGLATTPLIARNKTPSMVYGVVDTLIDPEKYPFTFRILPSNKQWTDAAHNYILKNLNAKKVALIGDATGYGTATVNLSEQELKRLGATISYKALIEANQSDVNSDMQKAKNSGAEVILVWSDSAALNARLINARAEANWTAPIVGHPALGSGAIKPLLTAPGNWNAVYNIGYKQTSFDKAGKLPDETSKFLASVVAKKVRVDDTTLWWIAAGYDAVQLIRRGYEAAGSSKPEDVKKAIKRGDWNEYLIHAEGKRVQTAPKEALRSRAQEALFSGAMSLTGISGRLAPVYLSPLELSPPELAPPSPGAQPPPARPSLRYALLLFALDGSVAGVLVVSAPLEPLLRPLLPDEPTDRVYLVDASGDYLAGPEPGQLQGSRRGTGRWC